MALEAAGSKEALALPRLKLNVELGELDVRVLKACPRDHSACACACAGRARDFSPAPALTPFGKRKRARATTISSSISLSELLVL